MQPSLHATHILWDIDILDVTMVGQLALVQVMQVSMSEVEGCYKLFLVYAIHTRSSLMFHCTRKRNLRMRSAGTEDYSILASRQYWWP